MTYKEYLAAFEQQGNQATPNLIAGVMPPLVLEIEGDPVDDPTTFIEALEEAFEVDTPEEALVTLYNSGITQIVIKFSYTDDSEYVHSVVCYSTYLDIYDVESGEPGGVIVFGNGDFENYHGFVYET